MTMRGMEIGSWCGTTLLELRAGGYRLKIAPEHGANIVSLLHEPTGHEILRTPPDLKTLAERPQLYGNALLFPPNRIGGAVFRRNGRTYDFPVNDAAASSFIHGFLLDVPWLIDCWNEYPAGVEATLTYRFGPENRYFTCFPHRLRIRMRFLLTENGLEQSFTFQNEGEELVPFGIGFHTAFNVPPCWGDRPRLGVDIAERWELDESMLPTGRFADYDEIDEAIARGDADSRSRRLARHYRARHQDGESGGGASRGFLEGPNGFRVVLETGPEFGHWFVWNGKEDQEFCCLEPQSWIVNAPNVLDADGPTGCRDLLPSEVWLGKLSIMVEDGLR